MTRIDPLLKLLQVRTPPPEGLVQACLIHIGDRSDTNFRKILELKGVRKQDQTHLVELFAIHRDGVTAAAAAGRPLIQNSPLVTPLMIASGLGSSGFSINPAAALPAPVRAGLQTQFDAASLGEKLLNAARDGVESMGTAGGVGSSVVGGSSPSLGIGGIGSGGANVLEKATINENIKNIGNLFRWDIDSIGGISGLGAWFGGKRDVTPTGSLDGTQR
jgi:hypothetical protein